MGSGGFESTRNDIYLNNIGDVYSRVFNNS